MSDSERYTWTAHGARWPSLNVIDWYAPGGPRVVACVPQTDDGLGVEAAVAAMRLLKGAKP